MKNKILKYILATALGFTSSVAFSDETVSTPTTPTATATPTASPVASTAASGNTVNQASNDNKSNNSSGSAMSYLTGGLLITMGTMHITEGYGTSPATNWALVAMGTMEVMMGLLSMKQGKESGGKSGASGLTAAQSAGSGYDYANTDVLPLLEANDPNVKAVQANLQKLKDMGVLDASGTTATINGKQYKMSDFTSKEAAMAAGYPAGAWDGAMDLGAKAAKAAADKVEKLGIGSRTAANGFEEGGGGGGALASSDLMYGEGGDGYGAGTAGAGAGGGIGLNRDPSSLAGMQKNYNGDPIGVAADSIFLMMTRRYKVKESQESFYTDAELALKK